MREMRLVMLRPDEERTLREAYLRGPKPEFRMRCLGLVMLHQLNNVQEIARHFGLSRQSIYNWLEAWHQEGLAGLYRHPGQGRKRKQR